MRENKELDKRLKAEADRINSIGRTPQGYSGLMLPSEKLDPNKLCWHQYPNTHSSARRNGVYPDGMTQEEVEKKVRGQFGGNFEKFRDGEFSYIAYTD